MKTVVDRDAGRKADLAAIHIGKAALGWDDDTYRDILFTVCRVRSSSQLDFAGRRRFLAHLRACGWTGGTQGKGAAEKRASAPVRAPLTRPQRKMWSLWQQLADAKRVDNRKMPALLAYVERQTGVARLEWLEPAQEALVIESLKKWLARGHDGPQSLVAELMARSTKGRP